LLYSDGDMELRKKLAVIGRSICASNCGNLTENIIQNIFMNKLIRGGLHCQKEVVVPVMMDDMFVGHNRFDIMVTDKTAAATKITILEIKTLTQSIYSSRDRERIFQQCIGYHNCVKKIMRDPTHVNVVLINVWKKREKSCAQEPYNFEIIEVALPKPKAPRTIQPRPIVKNRVKYFEIESILDSFRRRVLVKWLGFAAPSWEPMANIPHLVRRRYAHIFHPKKNKSAP